MDVHVPASITRGLRRRGVDVLTAQQDGAILYADADLLDRAGELGRLIFLMDADFLAEAARRQRLGLPFTSVVYVRFLDALIGRCIDDLILLSEPTTEEERTGRIIYLPL